MITAKTEPSVQDDWVVLAEGSGPPPLRQVPSFRRTVAWLLAAGLLVLGLVGAVASWSSGVMAEHEAMRAGVRLTDVIADAVVQPHLGDALSPDPARRAAFDTVVREQVLPNGLVRLKLFDRDGTVLYSDITSLIGRRVDFDPDERAVFDRPGTHASVSRMSGVENTYESLQGTMLEIRRLVSTAEGRPVLFEVYLDYATVRPLADRLRDSFLIVAGGTLVIFSTLLGSVLWHVLSSLREAHHERERLLRHAVDASATERRRVAATLHDGPVQELSAAWLVVSVAAERASEGGSPDAVGADIRRGAQMVRGAIDSLRNLLVDVHPPTLRASELQRALQTLTLPVSGRGVQITLDLDAHAVARLDDAGALTVYTVTRECLRNVVQHAQARTASVTLVPHGPDAVRVEIADDGEGFDPAAALADPEPGHLGLTLLAAAAEEGGADLRLASSTAGTRWQLDVPGRADR